MRRARRSPAWAALIAVLIASLGSAAVPKQIVADPNHACALGDTGGLECWGFNGGFQLGDGTMVNSSVPLDVTGLAGVATVAAGWQHERPGRAPMRFSLTTRRTTM